MRKNTLLIHHKGAFCPHTGAVSTPVYQVSTFRQDAVDRNRGYDYSRSGNPTRDVLEGFIAQVENGRFGFAFSSGMAAVSTCLMLLRPGDHLVATEGLYGGTYRVLEKVFREHGLSCTYADTTDIGALEDALKPETRAVYIETPCNPRMGITDIAAVADLAHEHGAFAVLDNTFMSPYLQNPLDFGIDIVVHSATKFLGGHSDLIAGLIALNDAGMAGRIKELQNALGAILSPYESWLLMRGMKTLGVRMEKGQKTAVRIAEWLCGRKEVERVMYPGLDEHPGADIHRRQAGGPGAMLSFRLRDCCSGKDFVENVSVWTLAVSLGGIESIITLPAAMTHLPYSSAERNRLGIDGQLVRLAVGIEDEEDLMDDLGGAFARCRKNME